MSEIIPFKTTDERGFLAVFSRLCVALRETQDDSGITQQVYFDALRDLPLDALERGAMALSRERGRRFFPTTAEWRAAAEIAATDSLRKALSDGQRDEPWRHECADCEDSGWVRGLTCDGKAHGACGRVSAHLAHDYTMACPCRATNRTYRRKLMVGGGGA